MKRRTRDTVGVLARNGRIGEDEEIGTRGVLKRTIRHLRNGDGFKDWRRFLIWTILNSFLAPAFSFFTKRAHPPLASLEEMQLWKTSLQKVLFEYVAYSSALQCVSLRCLVE